MRNLVCGGYCSLARSVIAAGVRALIVWGAFGQVAHAQMEPLPPVNENLPPVQLSASVTYDNNVARSSQALAEVRGIVPQDEIYSPSIQLNWLKAFEAETLYVTGVLGYDFYQHNSVLNREDIDLKAGLSEGRGYCVLATDGAFARHQSELQELTVAVTQNTETDTTLLMGLRCSGESRLSGFVSLTPAWSDNSAELLQTSNSRSIPLTAGLGYDLANIGKLSIFGEYENTSYPDRVVEINDSLVSDGYDLYSAGIRWERRWDERLKASLALSEISLRPVLPGDTGFDGVGYEINLAYRPTARLETDILLTRAANPVDRLNTTYSVDQIYRATIAYRLGARTKLSVDGQIADHHYFGAQINAGTDLTSQSIDSIDASLGYALRPGLAVAFTATEEHGTADIPAYRYDDTRVELSLSAAL